MNLDLRTLEEMLADFNGPLPEQLKMLNMIYSLHANGGVQSVNNKTGEVTLSAADVGALPDTYTPPVISVNGQTGAVSLDAADVGAEGEGTAVLLTGNQTVAGIKTFSSMPVITAGTARTGIPTVAQMYANKLIKPTVTNISANTTLSGAQVIGGFIVVDTTAALVEVTLPSGTSLETALTAAYGTIANGDAVKLKIMNINGTFGSKIRPGTGNTIIGSSDIATWFYADCTLIRTAANTFTLYRT